MGKNSRLKQQRRQENSGSTSTNKSKKILIGSIIAAGIAVVALIVILSWPSETTPNKESKSNEDHSQHTTQNSSKNDSSDQQENDKKQTEKADETPAEPNVTPSWRLLKSPALTSEPVQLSFQFSGYKDKQIITDYEKYHDKKMHLIAVSTDLNNFLHVHPDMQADGTFNASLDLKRSTTYKIYADGKSASKGLVNETAGLYVREPKDIPPNWDPKKNKLKVPPDVPAKLTVDADKEQTVEGLGIKLTTQDLQVGKQAKLTFSFKDAATGADITKLQTYLGAVGHVIIISEDLGEYVHTHPINNAQRGPNADFHAVFKKPGKFKLWGEFRYNGKQILVPYVIDVKN